MHPTPSSTKSFRCRPSTYELTDLAERLELHAVWAVLGDQVVDPVHCSEGASPVSAARTAPSSLGRSSWIVFHTTSNRTPKYSCATTLRIR